jgi:rubrerythrin
METRKEIEEYQEAIARDDLRETRHNNRNKAREARPSKHWCWGCDGFEIWDGQTCPRCGTVDGKTREKI